MDDEQINEVISDIEDAMDNLWFEISYEINWYHQYGTTVFEVDIDIDDDLPDDWDENVDDVVSEVASDWGGWTSWDGSCICLSIED